MATTDIALDLREVAEGNDGIVLFLKIIWLSDDYPLGGETSVSWKITSKKLKMGPGNFEREEYCLQMSSFCFAVDVL